VEVRSTELPANYLLTYIANTIPVAILIAVAGGVVLLVAGYKKIKVLPVALIMLAAFFPVVYAIESGMALYNGWRHILFFYPPFVLIAGLGIESVMAMLGKPVLKAALAVLCALGLAHPIAWSIKNHPYEYMYYNEKLGFDRGYYDYENDVWSISVRPATEWLVKNENLLGRKDTVTIGSNTALYVRYFLKTYYPTAKVKVIAASAKNYWEKKWDYLILNTIFLQTDYLQANYPPEGTIHTEVAGGHPITAVMKDTTHLQYQCCQAILAMNPHKADSLVGIYLKTTRKMNPYMCGTIAITKALNNQFEEGKTYGQKAIQYNDGDIFAHSALSLIAFKQNNLEEAVNHINDCLSISPKDAFVLQLADSIAAKIALYEKTH
jgi:tetratricopeptide (TPR) repeat protein